MTTTAAKLPDVDVAAAAKHRLGFDQLGAGQERAVQAALAGRDVLAIMPTGSGKSAIYQLAGELRRGLTVVISPLVALQRDQALGIAEHMRLGAAAELNATRSRSDSVDVLDGLVAGSFEYLFIAPE